MNVHEIGQLAFTAVKQRLKNTCDRLSGGENKRGGRILGLKRALEKAADLDERMARYERAYIPLLANKIKGMANPEPITLKTLPESIVDRYMSKEGANLVTIYPAVDILESVSRMKDDCQDEKMRAATQEVARVFAARREAADLLSIGAYKRGSNPLVDRALEIERDMREYLRQRRDEASSWEETRAALLEIMTKERKREEVPAR